MHELEYERLEYQRNDKSRSLSYQSLFFWMSGLTTLLPFTVLISMDQFWRDKFNKDATKYYPFISNGSGLLALLFYDRLNRISSFKTQIKWYPVIVGMSFPLLYAISFMASDKEQLKWVDLKNILFLAVVFLMSFVNTLLQVKSRNLNSLSNLADELDAVHLQLRRQRDIELQCRDCTQWDNLRYSVHLDCLGFRDFG